MDETVEMDDLPPVRSKKSKKLTPTQQNVLLGVATVAGLGLAGKLLSLLRRPAPSRPKDTDVQTLESALTPQNAANALPLQAQVQRTKLANLDNDEPDHEVVNGKRNTRKSKYADSFSEIVEDDEISKDGEIYVNQDPVGRRDGDRDGDRGRSKEKDVKDVSAFVSRKGKQVSGREGGGGGFNIKGAKNLHSSGEHDGDEDGEQYDSSPRNRLSKELVKKESTNTSGSSEKLHSTQSKKHRRATSADSKQSRKPKSGAQDKPEKSEVQPIKPEKRFKPKAAHSDLDSEKQVIIISEPARWESINGYKVLKSTTSHIPRASAVESMRKSEADDDSTTAPTTTSKHLLHEFQRQRAETEKAQSIWDGKTRTRRLRTTTGSESQACLHIKSSVTSSISNTEETPEGFKVREIVKRSTLLPIPSGDEGEVHSVGYNVVETEQGLKVEEMVTRTKLIPPSKGPDFSASDQELLLKDSAFRRKNADSLRFVAVLVVLFSFLFILYLKGRLALPFWS